MLANVRGGDKELCKGDGVVRKEEDLEVVLGLRVGVDDARGVDDEADRQLGDVVYDLELVKIHQDAFTEAYRQERPCRRRRRPWG